MSPEPSFGAASPEELAQGFVLDPAGYVCLLCGARFEAGRIYSVGEDLFEGQRAVREHVGSLHHGTAEWLLGLDRRVSGLSETQVRLFACLLAGQDDRETARAMAITPSTVRNHRFQLRERARQARVFLALMRLLETVPRRGEDLVEQHPTAVMVDERYATTRDEREAFLATYFPEGPQGRLRTFPAREKRKLVVLAELARRFQPDREYTETEVNAVLRAAWDDFATLRRYLIEYGFMERKPDGSAYWLK